MCGGVAFGFSSGGAGLGRCGVGAGGGPCILMSRRGNSGGGGFGRPPVFVLSGGRGFGGLSPGGELPHLGADFEVVAKVC